MRRQNTKDGMSETRSCVAGMAKRRWADSLLPGEAVHNVISLQGIAMYEKKRQAMETPRGQCTPPERLRGPRVIHTICRADVTKARRR